MISAIREKPLARYAAATAAVLIAAVTPLVLNALFHADISEQWMLIAPYVLGFVFWELFAIVERRRQIWRLLMAWAPALLWLGICAFVAITPDPGPHSADDKALGLGLIGGLFEVHFVIAFAATVVIWLYRPRETTAAAQ